jgi:hypothetical protein
MLENLMISQIKKAVASNHYKRGAILAILTAAVGFVAERSHLALTNEQWFGLGTLAFAVILGLYFDQLHRTNEHFEETNNNLNTHAVNVSEKLKAMHNGMKNNLEPMGRASDILKNNYNRLLTVSEGASEVKNTLITSASNYLASANKDQRWEIIKTVIQKNHSWHDIYSEHAAKILNKEISRFKSDYGTFYAPKVITTMSPIVNMLLFKCEKHSEVWFGFGLFDNYDGPVFRTTNDELCEFFNSYFDNLNAESRDWTERSPKNIEGAWVSVSYDNTSKDVQGIAIATIKTIGNELEIRGSLYCPDNNLWIPINSFRSTSSKFDAEKHQPILNFTFIDIQDGKEIRKGGGFCNFRSQDYLNEYEGEVVSFQGSGRLIFGKKLQEEINNKVTETGTFYVRELVQNLASKAICAKMPVAGDSPFNKNSEFWMK